MHNFIVKLATDDDADIVKDLINKMYGSEYETRLNEDIGRAIKNNKEIYVLAYLQDKCIGLAGASIDNQYYADIIDKGMAVIDYIYVLEQYRSIELAYSLIIRLFNALVYSGVKSAIMQVQTFNKQRFFHYALSNKHIIKTTPINRGKEVYEDQILLIEDLNTVARMTLNDVMRKAMKYLKEENFQ